MKEISLLFLLLMLSGCSAPVHMLPGAAGMAQDTATTLKKVYPPARTHLCVPEAPKDAFAKNLITSLRQQGYAVAERCEGNTLPLRSQVFTEGSRTMVSVQVNDRRFARAWDSTQKTPAALGVWTQGELSHARG